MFEYISGNLVEKTTNLAIIDVNGVGFKLFASHNSLASLEVNTPVTLWTHFKVSENAMDLYGFASIDERTAFDMLLSINGVGAKAAINILSVLTHSELAFAIIANEPKQITKAAGVGPKLANRIILELKDKIAKESKDMTFDIPSSTPAFTSSAMTDATSALLVLGFDGDIVREAIAGLDDSLTTEEIIKQALKKMR